jgi:serine/threonine protein kinase
MTKEKVSIFVDETSFNLITILGKGGYALVWKCSSKHNKQLFAIKIIDKYKILKKNCLRSILNER